MKTNMHKNSLAAYKALNLTKAQEKVARAILANTRKGVPSTNSTLLEYNIFPNEASPRTGEMLKMWNEYRQPFVLDGEEYALVVVGRQINPRSNKEADIFQLQPFAVVRAKWLEEQEKRSEVYGVQSQLTF